MMAARAIASVTRVACNKEGNCNGGKSDGDEGAGQASATWVNCNGEGDKIGDGDGNEAGRQ